jgi:hypothetical protein
MLALVLGATAAFGPSCECALFPAIIILIPNPRRDRIVSNEPGKKTGTPAAGQVMEYGNLLFKTVLRNTWVERNIPAFSLFFPVSSRVPRV